MDFDKGAMYIQMMLQFQMAYSFLFFLSLY